MSFQVGNSNGFLVVFEESVEKASDFVGRSLEAFRVENGESPSSSSPVVYVGSVHAVTFQRVINWKKNGEILDVLDLNSLYDLAKAAQLLQIHELFELASRKIPTIYNDHTEIGKENGSQVQECPIHLKNENAVESAVAAPSASVFDLLPEIWDFIIPRLSVTDFQSLINSSQRWRSTFKLQTPDRLLPLLFPILLKHCGCRKVSDLLRWRDVNKLTKSIVDSLLQESVSPSNCYENLHKSPYKWFPVRGNAWEEWLRLIMYKINARYELERPSQIQKLSTHMNSSPVSINPFVTNSVHFEFYCPVRQNELQELQLFKELGLSMLTQYGNGISNFSLGEIQSFDLQFISSLLSRLPNLKVLSIDGYVESEFDEEDVARWEPIVKLEHLEFLNVGYVREINFGALLNPLLRCVGTQLTRLCCSDDLFDKPENLVKLRNGDYPNLRFLRVRDMGYGFRDRIRDLDIDLRLPIEEIELTEHFFDDLTLNDFLPALRKFADSLTHLKLCFSMGVDENEPDIFVPLPNLTKFSTELQNIHTDWFRAFLQLQAEQLVELNFEATMNPDNFSGPDIDELKQFFETLPNLTKITTFCSAFLVPAGGVRERIEIERSGAVHRFKFECKIERDLS